MDDQRRPGAIARKWQLFEEAKIIITTTPSVEGKTIQEYLGIVTGKAILGAHLGSDIMTSLTDIVGGRSAEYEGEVRRARMIALKEMASEAED